MQGRVLGSSTEVEKGQSLSYPQSTEV